MLRGQTHAPTTIPSRGGRLPAILLGVLGFSRSSPRYVLVDTRLRAPLCRFSTGPACKVFQLTTSCTSYYETYHESTAGHNMRTRRVRDVHNFMHTTRILSLQVGTGAEPQSGFCCVSLSHFEGRTHTAGKHPAPGSSGCVVYVMYEGLHVAHPRTRSRPSTRVSQRRSR